MSKKTIVPKFSMKFNRLAERWLIYVETKKKKRLLGFREDEAAAKQYVEQLRKAYTTPVRIK